MTDTDDDIRPPTTGRIWMSGEHGTVHVADGGEPPAWGGVPDVPDDSDDAASIMSDSTTGVI